jgi:type I restriction enzyme S subunit
MENKLPKNWVNSNIEDSTEILDNKRKPVSASIRAKRLGDIPYYGATGVAGKIDDYIFDEELVLLGEDGAPFLDFTKNVAYLIKGKSWVNNHAHVLKAKEKITSNQFLLHFLNQCDYANYVGGTTRLKLNQGNLKSIPFPLPPLKEQQRIVAKLDVLFTHLEVLNTRLATIPQLLKNFKQAVLTQAVTGKLTEEWRVGRVLGEWEETKLINLVLQKPRNGYSPAGVSYVTKIKSLSLSATTSGKFNASKVKYLDIDKPDENSHLWLKKGDILIQRSNSLDYVGTSAIYDGEDNDFMYPDIMMKIQVNEKIDTSYMNYVLSSSRIRNYYKDNATGTAGNMPKINQVVVSNTPIFYPPKEEQSEIVKRVENLFAKADKIEEQYKILKEKTDSLPQAILAKAFKGELVEQLDTDGSAKELLAEIKKLKASSLDAKKTVKSIKETKEVLGRVADGKYKKR